MLSEKWIRFKEIEKENALLYVEHLIKNEIISLEDIYALWSECYWAQFRTESKNLPENAQDLSGN